MATTKRSTSKKSAAKKSESIDIDLQKALQEHFGFEKFKDEQEQIMVQLKQVRGDERNREP